MAKRRVARRIDPATRAKILATAKSQGLTAIQVEKKFGVSRWTYYGWRKRKGPGRAGTARRGRAPVAARGGGSLQREIRAVLPAILREEIARAITGLLGGGRVVRRRRRR